MPQRIKPLTLAIASVLAFMADGAHASAFQLLEQNASGLGNAYAGSAAVAENASTVFFNPAGMTALSSGELSMGLTTVKPSFKFSNNGSTVPNAGAASLAGEGNDGGSMGLIPNFPEMYPRKTC